MPAPDYYRRDQQDGVTAPDLSKTCFYAEHIVRARGKRTQYTSVSLDPERIADFGPALYAVLRDRVQAEEHVLVEHDDLLRHLRLIAERQTKAERARAIQALRYARLRLEGLVEWRFNTSGVERKDLIAWAHRHIQEFFHKA